MIGSKDFWKTLNIGYRVDCALFRNVDPLAIKRTVQHNSCAQSNRVGYSSCVA